MPEYGANFCVCETKKFVATFSAVQLALMYIPGRLHDAGEAITSECGLTAAAQIRYNHMMASIGDRRRPAVGEYFAPNFVNVDLSGRKEDVAQMLARMLARPKDALYTTTIQSAHQTGRTAIVERATFEGWPQIVDGKKQRHSTYTTFRDTWLIAPHSMLLDRSVTESVDTYIDGKEVSSRRTGE
jgi:hypothetical protein